MGRRWLLLPGLLGVAPSTAHAHLVQSGFGEFYDGVIHLVATPADVMLVVGMALLAGLRGGAGSRAVVLALPCAWLVGGIVGMGLPTETTPTWPTVLTFGIAGVLVAADARVERTGLVVFAAVAGLTHGWVNGASMTPGGADWLTLVGATTTALVIVTLVASHVVSLRATWARIVVRVAGSWLAAIGMLMAGWLVRTGAG